MGGVAGGAGGLRGAGAAVEYALRSQPLARQEEAGRKAGAAAFVVVGGAVAEDDHPTAARRYTVRRPGQPDLSFDDLAALVAWASPPTLPAP